MMQFLENDSVLRARDEDLKRAARHYRRAIEALGDSTFDSLNPVTAEKLRKHLMQEMRVVTAELERRGVAVEEEHLVPAVSLRHAPPPLRHDLAEFA